MFHMFNQYFVYISNHSILLMILCCLKNPSLKLPSISIDDPHFPVELALILSPASLTPVTDGELNPNRLANSFSWKCNTWLKSLSRIFCITVIGSPIEDSIPLHLRFLISERSIFFNFKIFGFNLNALSPSFLFSLIKSFGLIIPDNSLGRFFFALL